jgi:hypothetical protein
MQFHTVCTMVFKLGLAVTTIFLLAGVGITVNILIARLGRIVDRARVLESQ